MRLVRVGVAIALAMIVTVPTMARGPFYPESTAARKSRKFARGFVNTLFFWAEIPKEVNRDWQNVDPLTGVFTGTAKGVYKGGQRFGAGVYEMVTFRKDQPANYQPIVYPELPLEDGYDWGAEEYYGQQRQSQLY
ncbi:MAG: exosortase system-associated protein, TIGR04073 family [Candidatus Sumerlaeaceae bacterium]